MRIEKFVNTNVAEDGKTQGGGAVVVNGGIHTSAPEGGCGSGNCNCSPGHWITIIMPRTIDGKVECIRVQFDSKAEKDKYLK